MLLVLLIVDRPESSEREKSLFSFLTHYKKLKLYILGNTIACINMP